MGYAPIRSKTELVFLVLASALVLAGCAQRERQDISGFITQPPANVRCLVTPAPASAGRGSASGLEAKIVTALMPGCRILASGPADVLIELSWTRRESGIGFFPGTAEAALSDASTTRSKRGVIYTLAIHAREIDSGTVIADARVTQRLRRAHTSSREHDLILALSQRAAGLAGVKPIQDAAR